MVVTGPDNFLKVRTRLEEKGREEERTEEKRKEDKEREDKTR